jgi:sugar O-acyltransferase (sialic acid O-acetyltransferase NeuD family)
MNDLVIFGCEFREVVKLLDAINRRAPRWRLRGFIDDRPEMRGCQVFGIPVLGDRSLLPELAAQGVDLFSNVTGKVRNARAIAALLEQTGRPVVSLVHPALDLGYVELGRGAILPEGCVVGSGTVIGNYLACRLHAVISHDVTIDDFVFIGPGAVLGSGVHLEEGVFIGAGVTVKTGCRIGRHTVVGAGALVAEDVGPDMTVAGVRGRVVKAGGRD